MTKIYLVRHAEAEGNLYRISQGQSNSNITDRGYRQIAALQKRFEKISVDAVYSSDLYRTCITAEAVYLPKRLPLHKRRDLREIYVGNWEGMTWGDIARRYPEQMQNFLKHLDRWHIDGAETPRQVRDRMLHALRAIAGENPNETVAVFSHGMAIQILLGALQGYSFARIGETHCGDNTAVSLLEEDGGELKVIFRDDNSHLRLMPFSEQDCQHRKTPNGTQPGLYFLPAELPEQCGFLKSCTLSALQANGEAGNLNDFLRVEERPTLTAVDDGTPVGVIQLDPEREKEEGSGWISLYYILENFRTRGCGVQMLGQAVQYYRERERKILCIALNEKNQSARRFFAQYGFRETEERTGDGQIVCRKDIAFPEI